MLPLGLLRTGRHWVSGLQCIKINMSIHKSSTIHEVIIEIEYRMNGRDSAKRKKQNRKRKKKKKKSKVQQRSQSESGRYVHKPVKKQIRIALSGGLRVQWPR